MKCLEDIKKILSEERPVCWDDLPDMDLYMDQVLGYIHRQLYSSRQESQLTASMVNNYVRDGLLVRTKGKKYSRAHVARLTTICILKQVLSVADIALLIKTFPPDTLYQVYDTYRNVLDSDLTAAVKRIPDDDDPLVIADAIVRFIMSSYANKVAAEHLIDLIKHQKSASQEDSP